MTAFTLGEARALSLHGLARDTGLRSPAHAHPRAPRSGSPHRTGAPVRRDSIEAGTIEDLSFAVPAPGETDRLLRVARCTLDARRQLRREARSGTRTHPPGTIDRRADRGRSARL